MAVVMGYRLSKSQWQTEARRDAVIDRLDNIGPMGTAELDGCISLSITTRTMVCMEREGLVTSTIGSDGRKVWARPPRVPSDQTG